MRRREFLWLLGGWTVASPLTVAAQHNSRVWRVGVVRGGSQDRPGWEALGTALAQNLIRMGYSLGTDLAFSDHLVTPSAKNFEDAITALLPSIDILVVWSTVGAVAAKKVGAPVPTIFLSVGAPASIGIVESLARPGGNMTGVTFEAAQETYAKRLQILKEIVPGIKRVAVLRAAGDANVSFAMESLAGAAPALLVTLLPIDIRSVDDLETTFAAMAREQADALIVVAGSLTYFGGKRIADLALQHRLPSCHAFKETAAAGGLVSLGPDLLEMARQGATFIDRIIRGAKPAELPVEQPTRYELHINLKTAKGLGLTVPPSLLARADEVIE